MDDFKYLEAYSSYSNGYVMKINSVEKKNEKQLWIDRIKACTIILKYGKQKNNFRIMYLDSSFHLIIEKKPKYGNNYEINIRKKIFKKLKIKKMKLRILLNPKVREKKIGNIKNKG